MRNEINIYDIKMT